ncbi:MAG: SDR family NAD(P)-dependent oxidoreductase [Anaerolineae bacterium]|nr:SDR family NAD(P)-dependent oxidoreductase [Anaerolineae bacterium]
MATRPGRITARADHFRLQPHKATLLSAAVDALIVAAAYVGVLSMRAFITPFGWAHALGFICPAVVITLAALCGFGVYRRIWSRTSGHGVTVLFAAVAVATAVLGALDVGIDAATNAGRPMPLSVLAVGSALAFSGLVAVRYRSRLRTGLAWRWRAVWFGDFPRTPTRVLVVGAGGSGQTLAWRLKHRAPQGERYVVVGFIDDDPAKQGRYIEGAPVLGTRGDIPRVAEAQRVDLIVMALHNVAGPDFRAILAQCQDTRARIKVVPNMFACLQATEGAPALHAVQPEDFLGRSAPARDRAIDLTPLTGKVILVTGAAGSVGFALCRRLIDLDIAALLVLDNNESGLHDTVTALRACCPEAVVWPVLVNVADAGQVARAFRAHRPHVVFHAAAYKHVPMLEIYPEQAVRVNIGGTWNLAHAALEAGAERFVLVSTVEAANPAHTLGATKRICEQILEALSQPAGGATRFTSVRLTNVVGSRGSVVPTFAWQVDHGGPVTVTDPDMARCFMSQAEAVDLILAAACLTEGGDRFACSTGDATRIIDLAERMIRTRGLRPHEDIAIRVVGRRPGEQVDCDGVRDREVLATLGSRTFCPWRSKAPAMSRPPFWSGSGVAGA